MGLPLPHPTLFSQSQLAGVEGAAAQRPTQKAEDLTTILHDQHASCFAVFDGHGGVRAAQACVERLAPRLLGLSSSSFAKEEVEREFWRIDNELGCAGVSDGTTATVLLVCDRAPAHDEAADSVHSSASTVSAGCRAEDGLMCAIAHVGDSTAIRVDMNRIVAGSNHGSNHGVSVIEATSDHTPRNDNEIARLQRHWAVRDALAAGHGDAYHHPLFTATHKRRGSTDEDKVDELANVVAQVECSDPAALGATADSKHPRHSCGTERHKSTPSLRQSTVEASDQALASRCSINSDVSDTFAHASTVFGDCQSAARLRPGQVASAVHYVMSSGDEDSNHGPSRRVAPAALARPRAASKSCSKDVSVGSRGSEFASKEEVKELWLALQREVAMHHSLFARLLVRRSESTVGFRGVSPAVESTLTSATQVANLPLAVKTLFKDGTEGPSTCVTRSIGDWDASRAVTPHPEVSRFFVPAGRRERVIIASDGVWDRLSHSQAAGVARRCATPAKAAEAIAKLAEQKTLYKFNKLMDDISVVCVDLCPPPRNPGLPNALPECASAPCPPAAAPAASIERPTSRSGIGRFSLFNRRAAKV